MRAYRVIIDCLNSLSESSLFIAHKKYSECYVYDNILNLLDTIPIKDNHDKLNLMILSKNNNFNLTDNYFQLVIENKKKVLKSHKSVWDFIDFFSIAKGLLIELNIPPSDDIDIEKINNEKLLTIIHRK